MEGRQMAFIIWENNERHQGMLELETLRNSSIDCFLFCCISFMLIVQSR